MILNLIQPSDRPYSDEPVVGHYLEIGDPVDASALSASPFIVFVVSRIPYATTCLIEESDDLSSWSAMSGVSFSPSVSEPPIQLAHGTRTKQWVRATVEYDIVDSADRWGISVIIGDVEDAGVAEEPEYLGRFQQGQEVALVLQCTDADGDPEDPASTPFVQIRRDPDASLVETLAMPADLRSVETGLFRRPLFLGAEYSVTGRHVAIFKWLDSDGVPHVKTAHFHVLPNGSADGGVIAMCYSSRPNAAYLIYQCDSGRLIRKPNPR